MARSSVKLVDFDQDPIVEYAITERELVNVYQYVQAI